MFIFIMMLPLNRHHALWFVQHYSSFMGFPGGSVVKKLPAMQEIQVQSLCQEDPLEKEMAIHSSTLAWKMPWTKEPGRLQSMRLQKSHILYLATKQQQFFYLHQLMVSSQVIHGVIIPFSSIEIGLRVSERQSELEPQVLIPDSMFLPLDLILEIMT